MSMDAEEFERVHGVLLASCGLPRSLVSQLQRKLSGEIFDGGDFFEIETLEDGLQRRLLLSSPETLKKESDVFLVDHAWSFRLSDARKQLDTIPGLGARMSALMCVGNPADAEVEEGNEESGDKRGKATLESIIRDAEIKADGNGKELLWLELDDLDINDSDLQSLNLQENFPNLVGLSLWGNKLESFDGLLKVVGGLVSLRALWLNKTPIDIKLRETAVEAILQVLPQLEIYNSCFTKHYSRWAVEFCASLHGADSVPEGEPSSHVLKQVTDLDLSDRKIGKLLVQIFNPTELPFLTSLNIKGNPLEGDSASNLVQTLKALSIESLQVDIPGPLGSSAVAIVDNLPKLRSLNGIDVSTVINGEKEVVDGNLKPWLTVYSPEVPLTDRVLGSMWQYIMMYRLADEEKLDETPIWYVMDELGSALRHSDAPNFQVAPFMYLPDGTLNSAISYSLLWPIQDVKHGDECTRDYLFGIGEDNQRSARLTAWFHTPKSYFTRVYRKYQDRLSKIGSNRPAVMGGSPTKSSLPSDGRTLKVYSDIPFVLEFLQRPEFTIVEDHKEADILWTSEQVDEDFIKAVGIKPDQYINQFPYESCLVMKHHLAQTMQQAYGCPVWLQPTYNMETEVAVVIGDYWEREEQSLNNLWIVKPWNMARTIDTTVTRSLPALIRLVETGPKICQKYIDPPALFQGRKFDLRYVVLLRSLQPLEVYITDAFWARFSNNQYTTEESSLSEYETHFTVMNYRGTMNHISTHDFVPEFEKEHNVEWKEIHKQVKYTLRKVFEGAALVHPEMHSPRARAIYGVDLMLDNTFQPKLLEVTYCPDLGRACKYDVKNVWGNGEVTLGKEFMNCVFGTLFLNEEKNVQPL